MMRRPCSSNASARAERNGLTCGFMALTCRANSSRCASYGTVPVSRTARLTSRHTSTVFIRRYFSRLSMTHFFFAALPVSAGARPPSPPNRLFSPSWSYGISPVLMMRWSPPSNSSYPSSAATSFGVRMPRSIRSSSSFCVRSSSFGTGFSNTNFSLAVRTLAGW